MCASAMKARSCASILSRSGWRRYCGWRRPLPADSSSGRRPARSFSARAVSTSEPYTYTEEGRARVAVVDYGVKRSVLRRLAAAGAAVRVYPHDVDADELAGYDGVLLSPGPGDPEPLQQQTREQHARARSTRTG